MITGSSAFSMFVLGHRFAISYPKEGFNSSAFKEVPWHFWVSIILLYLSSIVLTRAFLYYFEKDFKRRSKDDLEFLRSAGAFSVRNGVVLTGFLFITCILATLVDRTFINVWDVLFIIIFLGLYYIGVFLYFYYGASLQAWTADDRQIELEKLKLEYEDQRIYLRIFLWITVSFFVSQVFGVLKTKFEPYLRDPSAYAHFQPIMVINVTLSTVSP